MCGVKASEGEHTITQKWVLGEERRMERKRDDERSDQRVST